MVDVTVMEETTIFLQALPRLLRVAPLTDVLLDGILVMVMEGMIPFTTSWIIGMVALVIIYFI